MSGDPLAAEAGLLRAQGPPLLRTVLGCTPMNKKLGVLAQFSDAAGEEWPFYPCYSSSKEDAALLADTLAAAGVRFAAHPAAHLLCRCHLRSPDPPNPEPHAEH